METLKQACFQGYPESAGCVQVSIDSRNSAIHSAYRISLRPSSLFEPRHPSLKVVIVYNLVRIRRQQSVCRFAIPNSASLARRLVPERTAKGRSHTQGVYNYEMVPHSRQHGQARQNNREEPSGTRVRSRPLMRSPALPRPQHSLCTGESWKYSCE